MTLEMFEKGVCQLALVQLLLILDTHVRHDAARWLYLSDVASKHSCCLASLKRCCVAACHTIGTSNAATAPMHKTYFMFCGEVNT